MKTKEVKSKIIKNDFDWVIDHDAAELFDNALLIALWSSKIGENSIGLLFPVADRSAANWIYLGKDTSGPTIKKLYHIILNLLKESFDQSKFLSTMKELNFTSVPHI